MEYRIEKNVPLPSTKPETFSDTLRAMKKGDSLKLDKAKRKNYAAIAHSVLGAGHYTVRSNGSSIRIWRI